MANPPTIDLEEFGIDPNSDYWKKYAARKSGGASVSAAPPRSAWEILKDSISETFDEAGHGLNAILLRGNQADREDDLIRSDAQRRGMTPNQTEAIIRQNQQQRAVQINERRAQQELLMQEEQRRRSTAAAVAAKAAEIAGSVIGDINPTYALPAFGEGAIARSLGMGGVTGAADLLSQIDEYRRKIRDHIDPLEVGTSAAAGAAFQGAGEAVAKGVSAVKNALLPKDIVKGLLNRGLTLHQARGVTAGIVAESRANPNIRNPDSGAFGYGQWLGSRQKELFRRYGPNPTHDQQLDFLVHELRGGDHGGPKVLAQKDQKSVLNSYIRDFMRPAKGKETLGDLRRGSEVLGEPVGEGHVDDTSLTQNEQPSAADQAAANNRLSPVDELTSLVPHDPEGFRFGEGEDPDYSYMERPSDRLHESADFMELQKTNPEMAAKIKDDFDRLDPAEQKNMLAEFQIDRGNVERIGNSDPRMAGFDEANAKMQQLDADYEAGKISFNDYMAALNDIPNPNEPGATIHDIEPFRRAKDYKDASDMIDQLYDNVAEVHSDVLNGRTINPEAAEKTRSSINSELRNYEPGTPEYNKLLEIDDMLKEAIAHSGGKPRLYEPDATEKFMGEPQERRPANDLDDDLSPSEETIKSKPGVNARRMATMLGPQLYGDPASMGPVSVKEVLQNSFDAVKTALQNKGLKNGKIDIDTDPKARTIRMRDNGIGMTPETLGGKFLEIAGTGKESEGSSGGFGIAKMQFLYGNEKLHVVTMRDGKVSEMHTTGEQLFNALDDPSNAPNIEVRRPTFKDEARFPEGHGTIIEMTIPEKYKDPASGEMKDIEFPESEYHVPAARHSPLFAPIDVTWNGGNLENMGNTFPADKFKTFANVDFGWGKADIYVHHTPQKFIYGNNLHVLSNGLWQFDKRISKKPGDPFSDPVPYEFYVDIHPNVKPEEAGYPFSFNRQGFTERAGKEFSDVTDYINKLYAHADLHDSAKRFATVEYLNPATGKISDPVDLTPEIPETVEGGFRGIQEGDQVSVKDGRMFVNGKELPALTPEQLKNSVPSHKELMVNPDKIDPNQIMIHDNTVVRGTEDQGVVDYMRNRFGTDRFNGFLRDTGSVFGQLRDMIAGLGEEYAPLKNEALGVSFDPKYRGVSIRVPFHGSFINPLAAEGKGVYEQAYGILGTMIHEFAHFQIRSHNAEFPAEMQRLTYKLAANHHFMDWQKDAAEVLATHKDILEHGQELFEKRGVKARGDAFKDGISNFEFEGRDEGVSNGVHPAREASESPEGIHPDAPERSEPAASNTFGTSRPNEVNRKPLEQRKAAEGHDETEPTKPILNKTKNKLIDKLGDAIEQGKPLRREAEAAIMKERSRRLAAVYKVRGKKGGEAGFYAELAALKGEMGRPKVESIRHWFTPQEINQLYDIVKNSPALEGYETINAQAALKKLLGAEYGEIPTAREIELLAKAMPRQAKIWRQLLEDEEGSLNLDNLPISKAQQTIVNVAGLSRTLKASFDFSAPFRQGWFLLGRKEFWKAMPGMFKSFFSEGHFNKIQQEILDRDTFPLMNRAGLQTTKNNAGLLDREEAFISQFAEKIPGVRHSERAYIAFLNKVRADVFDDFVRKGEAMGIDFIQDPHYLKSAARFINSATGRGNLNAITRDARVLGNVFFSPKLMKSRFDMLNPVFYAGLHPKVRKEAAKQGLISTGVALSILGMAGAAGADVETDPRSSDFAKIKIGNTRFDITGGFQPYVRFYAQFLMGQQKGINDGKIRNVGTTLKFLRDRFPGKDQPEFKPTTRKDLLYNFFENKESPNMAEITKLLREGDAVGNPLGSKANPIADAVTKTTGFKNAAFNEAVDLVTPLIVSDTYESVKELGAKGLLTAIPNAAGVGVQTYQPKVKKSGISLSEFGVGADDFKDTGTISLKDFQ